MQARKELLLHIVKIVRLGRTNVAFAFSLLADAHHAITAEPNHFGGRFSFGSADDCHYFVDMPRINLSRVFYPPVCSTF